MKPKRLFVAVLCLFVLAVIGHAQEAEQPGASTQEQMDEIGFQKAVLEGFIRPYWEGRQGANPMLLEALDDPDIRSVWGVSDEQMHQLEANAFASLSNQSIAIPESPGIIEPHIQKEGETVTLSWNLKNSDESRHRKIAFTDSMGLRFLKRWDTI